MKKFLMPWLALATLAIGPSQNTVADVVSDWNAIAVQTLRASVPPRPGPVAFVDLAIVHVAIHDAVQGIDKRYQPYETSFEGGTGVRDAAAAKAAHDVLVNIVPSQAAAVDASYHAYMGKRGLSETDPGVTLGAQAADGIISLRLTDNRVPVPLPPPFIGGTGIGVWRPTASDQPGPPATMAPMASPWLGAADCFTLTGGAQFRVSPPPPLDCKRYARDYNEIKALGARFNSTRTAEQTDLAYFYHSDQLILTWNSTLRGISDAHINNVGDSARLFALVYLSIADGVITTWESKLHYNFWRPVTAIRDGENDGNPETAGDPTWEPLINTPPYPDWPSGANCATGALTRTLELFFGTDAVTFTVTSENPLVVQKTRTYQRFSDMSDDLVDVRMYQGIHFRLTDTSGRKLGRDIARWVYSGFLRPLQDDCDGETDDEF